MTESEKLFHELAAGIPSVKEGKMFGSICIKTGNGKSPAMLWKNHLVVKLGNTDLKEVGKLKGVKFFEPMKGRPMKEWLQVPFDYSDRWAELMKKSVKYILTSTKA